MLKIIRSSIYSFTIFSILTFSIPSNSSELYCSKYLKSNSDEKIFEYIRNCISVSYLSDEFDKIFNSNGIKDTVKREKQMQNFLGIGGFPDQKTVWDGLNLWEKFEEESQKQTSPVKKYTSDLNTVFDSSLFNID